jgi:predicted nucleotidyltransferase
MTSVVKMLSDKKCISVPSFAREVHYETIMGSAAYNLATDLSDIDIYAFCIPSKNIVFPHLGGFIPGFGTVPHGFEQFQQHHIKDPNGKDKEYDIVIYNIVKYFTLCMDCNPNMIDSLYTPDRCVIHATEVGRLVRANKHLFLSKKSFHSFKGYAYSQLHKCDVKKYENSKRKDVVERLGFDPKHLYHVRRLLGEAEQILLTGTIDLGADNEALKAVKRGDVKPEEVRAWFQDKEAQLDKLYHESTAVPNTPDEEKIKQLLIDCLEIHYGSLSDILIRSDSVYKDVVSAIKKALQDGGCL